MERSPSTEWLLQSRSRSESESASDSQTPPPERKRKKKSPRGLSLSSLSISLTPRGKRTTLSATTFQPSRPSDRPPFLLDLPLELIYRIIAYCQPSDLLILRSLCMQLLSAVDEDYLWKLKMHEVSFYATPQLQEENTSALALYWSCAHVHERWKAEKSSSSLICMTYAPVKQLCMDDEYLVSGGDGCIQVTALSLPHSHSCLFPRHYHVLFSQIWDRQDYSTSTNVGNLPLVKTFDLKNGILCIPSSHFLVFPLPSLSSFLLFPLPFLRSLFFDAKITLTVRISPPFARLM